MSITIRSVAKNAFDSQGELTFETQKPDFPVVAIVILVIIGIAMVASLIFGLVKRKQWAREAEEQERKE
eukprot:CAMPEP_0116885326 /NCGR_PEP_ID=MMETSP0463-20121206/18613_1 /TAXON_ID=181622 /ORGANISM="Strombidinopsis sp, Strain SopsisLIS2011" /LENGTH=68 /DNA_ID=CAMNT_0004543509 /DNA_START=8 /DNA_END=214 /DNA_ORIENTATION=+